MRRLYSMSVIFGLLVLIMSCASDTPPPKPLPNTYAHQLQMSAEADTLMIYNLTVDWSSVELLPLNNGFAYIAPIIDSQSAAIFFTQDTTHVNDLNVLTVQFKRGRPNDADDFTYELYIASFNLSHTLRYVELTSTTVIDNKTQPDVGLWDFFFQNLLNDLLGSEGYLSKPDCLDCFIPCMRSNVYCNLASLCIARRATLYLDIFLPDKKDPEG
ncbi:hypothetical protein KKG41_06210 [Patescibacteria group bacterium]|nr:hypothetical protein [Patescibacteria group bacterium]MBU1891083.1 hypothetical protein [Patescibacteria group bacterium]